MARAVSLMGIILAFVFVAAGVMVWLVVGTPAGTGPTEDRDQQAQSQKLDARTEPIAENKPASERVGLHPGTTRTAGQLESAQSPVKAALAREAQLEVRGLEARRKLLETQRARLETLASEAERTGHLERARLMRVRMQQLKLRLAELEDKVETTPSSGASAAPGGAN